MAPGLLTTCSQVNKELLLQKNTAVLENDLPTSRDFLGLLDPAATRSQAFALGGGQPRVQFHLLIQILCRLLNIRRESKTRALLASWPLWYQWT